MMNITDFNNSKAIKIIELIDEYFEVNCRGLGRKREVVLPRQMAMYYIRKCLNLSYVKIGMLFPSDKAATKFKTHCSVMHSDKIIKDFIKFDKEIKGFDLDLLEKVQLICKYSEQEIINFNIIKGINTKLYRLKEEDLKEITEYLEKELYISNSLVY